MNAAKAALVLACCVLAGCATRLRDPVVMPPVVNTPVDASPGVVVPPEPIEEPLRSRSPEDVALTASIRLEQWRDYARRLQLLLKPFAVPAPEPKRR